MIRFDRFTERAQDAATRAYEILQRYGHNQLDNEHLLLALLEQPDGVVPQLIERLGADPGGLRSRLDDHLRTAPKANIYGGGTGQVFGVDRRAPGRAEISALRLPPRDLVGSGPLLDLIFQARRTGTARLAFAPFRRAAPTLLFVDGCPESTGCDLPGVTFASAAVTVMTLAGARATAQGQAGNLGVLLRHPFDPIQDQDGQVGPAQRPHGASDAVALHSWIDPAAPADAGRVDEAEMRAAHLHQDVDRIARGARRLVDDRALVVDETVEERRLADVRTTDDGHADRTFGR